MSLVKKYLKTKPVCSVKFSITADSNKKFKTASVVGDFNNWDPKVNKMRRLKSGKFETTIKFPLNNEYQFRYLLDDSTWKNENEADKFVITFFGDSENSVIKI